LDRQRLAKALQYGLTTIGLTDSLSPLVCSNGGKKMVILPVRPGTEPPAPPTVKQEAVVPAKVSNPEATPPTAVAPVTTSNATETMKTETAPQPEKPKSAMQQISEQIENIRNGLKTVLNDLNAAITLIRQAEKDRKINDREVELVRNKLREIQSVTI
jgi:hypothetical protein